jgi:peptidyl-prolyl cis-trans isomerase A (cyclophilin A)
LGQADLENLWLLLSAPPTAHNDAVRLSRRTGLETEMPNPVFTIWALLATGLAPCALGCDLDAGSKSQPYVLIRTSLGDIEVELDAEHAPVTTKNFLRYVQAGYYRGGRFHRTVTLSNQPTDRVRIQVIQASADPAQHDKFPAPIALERTRDTGLHHVDGTISMARDGPDTAQDEFFICVGDQPQLDFGGRRNPDGQGFAAFGRVVKGMDVVQKIHGCAADGQRLNPPIRIERVTRVR